jgi:hypothetical protein
MKKQIKVQHCGLTINISRTSSRNKINGRVYESYQLADYSTGTRKKLTYSDLEEAKQKARELAEAKATGARHILDWDAQTHAQVRRAIAVAAVLGLNVDDVCQRFADAVKILGGDPNLMLPAAHHFKQHSTAKVIKPKTARDAAAEFLADHSPTISLRRAKTNATFLAQFVKVFGQPNLHEIESLEIQGWIRS